MYVSVLYFFTPASPPFEGPGHWHRCSNHAQLSGLGAGVFCDLCWSLQSSSWPCELWQEGFETFCWVGWDDFRNVFPQFLKIGCSSTLWGIILPGWFDYIWLIRSPKKAAHHRRTLFGTLPTRHQQGDLNYFQPIPGKVQELLDTVQAEMLKIGCPMAVKHNEVGATRNARKLRSF